MNYVRNKTCVHGDNLLVQGEGTVDIPEPILLSLQTQYANYKVDNIKKIKPKNNFKKPSVDDLHT